MRLISVAVLVVLVSVLGFAQAQPAEAKPSFEVASVRPNTGGRGSGRGSPDPTQFNSTNIPLRLLLIRAFDVKYYQIVGPSWLQDLSGAGFDIHAKAAEGTTKEQIPLMLQTLLVERFGMKFHHETRDLPAYELVVAKGGAKLKEASPQVDEPITADNPGRGGGVATQKDKDGLVELAPGRKGRMIMSVGPGRLRISARLQSIADILQMCESQSGRAIVDKTGLTGTYDYNLDFTMNGQLVRGRAVVGGSSI